MASLLAQGGVPSAPSERRFGRGGRSRERVERLERLGARPRNRQRGDSFVRFSLPPNEDPCDWTAPACRYYHRRWRITRIIGGVAEVWCWWCWHSLPGTPVGRLGNGGGGG